MTGPKWNDEQSTPVESDSRQRLLRDLRDTVYAPTFERFATASDTLKAASLAWQSDRDESKLEVLKQAWREAMADWQRAELMQIGLSGASGRRIGVKTIVTAFIRIPFRTAVGSIKSLFEVPLLNQFCRQRSV